MKRKAIVSAIMATCLTTGGFAFAQSYETRDHGGRIELAQHGEDRDPATTGAMSGATATRAAALAPITIFTAANACRATTITGNT